MHSDLWIRHAKQIVDLSSSNFTIFELIHPSPLILCRKIWCIRPKNVAVQDDKVISFLWANYFSFTTILSQKSAKLFTRRHYSKGPHLKLAIFLLYIYFKLFQANFPSEKCSNFMLQLQEALVTRVLYICEYKPFSCLVKIYQSAE